MAKASLIKDSASTIKLDKVRTLVYDMNAFIEMEDRYGSVDEAMKALDGGSIKAIRFILWIGLVHADDTLTEKQVGSLIKLNQLEEVANAVAAALEKDLPVEDSKNV